MNEWLMIFGMMAATFLPRFLPLLLAEHMHFPEWLIRAFHYVPIAVLSAIIAQTTLIRQGEMQFNWHNPHLIAALIAFVIALRCRQQLVVIIGGLIAFAIARYVLL